MDIQRKISKVHTTVGPPAGNPDPGGNVTTIAPLITMIAVLAIILIFCFCGAPAVRDFCKRRVCCCCPFPKPEETPGTPIDNGSTTPTIILLPFGRMLVVDRSVFAQFHTNDAGLDFMELSANLIRAHRLHLGSTPSILESEATSKGLSPTSLGFSPPSYDEIFRRDLPPSYSEVSLMFRQTRVNSSDFRNEDIAEGVEPRVHVVNERAEGLEGTRNINNGIRHASDNHLNDNKKLKVFVKQMSF